MQKVLIVIIAIFYSFCVFGQKWVELGTNFGLNSAYYGINSLCLDKKGNLYAAGVFKDTNGYEYVAKWDGKSWQEVGTGINALNADTSIYAICTDTSGNIYAGGAFSDSSGGFYVKKWNGASWTTLGQSQFGFITSICTDDSGNIYASHDFPYGGWASTYVAKWNGISWQMLDTGFGFNCQINSICIDKSYSLYVAGNFLDSAGRAYVAKWNGIAWSKVGADSNSYGALWETSAICSDKFGNIYAAFSYGNNNLSHVAKLIGNTWVELGTNVNQFFAFSNWSITTDTFGNVFVSGLDSSLKYNIAKWDGYSWSEVGTGKNALNANSYIFSMCIDKLGNIYATGDFKDSNGKLYVAEYGHFYLDSICSSDSILIGINPDKGHSYSWTSKPPGFSSSNANPTVSPISTTSYYLSDFDSITKNSEIDSTLIKVNPLPEAKWTAINNNGSLVFKPIDLSNISYLWYFGNGETSIKKQPSCIYKDDSLYQVKLITTNEFGCSNGYDSSIQVTLTDIPKNLASALNLIISPNPFTQQATISYRLSAYFHVNIEIEDIGGKLIKLLVDAKQSQGEYNITFDANKYSVSPGAYFAKLIVNNTLITKKIIKVE